MISRLDVRRIALREALTIRHPVLRTGMPLEAAIFPGDEAESTIHLGAFAGEALIGVASVYHASFPEKPEEKPARQLRGMAVVEGERRRGAGLALVRECERHAGREGAMVIWCNARTPAVEFYRRARWITIGEEFEIPTAGPHFRMWRALTDAD